MRNALKTLHQYASLKTPFRKTQWEKPEWRKEHVRLADLHTNRPCYGRLWTRFNGEGRLR
jgi:hypothetical protein